MSRAIFPRTEDVHGAQTMKNASPSPLSVREGSIDKALTIAMAATGPQSPQPTRRTAHSRCEVASTGRYAMHVKRVASATVIGTQAHDVARRMTNDGPAGISTTFTVLADMAVNTVGIVPTLIIRKRAFGSSTFHHHTGDVSNQKN